MERPTSICQGLGERCNLSPSIPETRVIQQLSAPNRISVWAVSPTPNSTDVYQESVFSTCPSSSTHDHLQQELAWNHGHNPYASPTTTAPLNLINPGHMSQTPESIRPTSLEQPTPFYTTVTPTSTRELTFSDSKKIVAELMGYRKRGVKSDSYCKAAINSLIKKLKKKPEQLTILVSALRTNGNHSGGCVVIRRSRDGKLHFEGSREDAHVVYTRIWRWPQVQDSQLTHIESCNYAFKRYFNSICINPYHYKHISPLPTQITIGNTNFCPSTSHSLKDNSDKSPTVLPRPVKYHNHREPANTGLATFQSLPATSCPIPLEHYSFPQVGVFPLPNPEISRTSPQLELQEKDDPLQLPQLQSSGNALQVTRHHPSPRHWCSISYFEYQNQVGETFKAPSTHPLITIDGFVNTRSQNFYCLGALSNLSRTEQSKETRLLIGKGVQLGYQENGDIWLTCLSNWSVFLQSCYLDMKAGRLPGEAVHKVYPRTCLKVFDFDHFKSVIPDHLDNLAKVRALPSGTTNFSAPFISPDDLSRFCQVQLSFVNGWSGDYERDSIEQTPCWIQVNIHHAFCFLDNILCNMVFQLPSSPISQTPSLPQSSLSQTSQLTSPLNSASIHPVRLPGLQRFNQM